MTAAEKIVLRRWTAWALALAGWLWLWWHLCAHPAMTGGKAATLWWGFRAAATFAYAWFAGLACAVMWTVACGIRQAWRDAIEREETPFCAVCGEVIHECGGAVISRHGVMHGPCSQMRRRCA